MTGAWSALSKSAGSEVFQTACWPYLVYDRSFWVHDVVSSSDGQSPHSQLGALHGSEGPATTAQKTIETPARMRSSAVDQATLQLFLTSFSHLHGVHALTVFIRWNTSKILRGML